MKFFAEKKIKSRIIKESETSFMRFSDTLFDSINRKCDESLAGVMKIIKHILPVSCLFLMAYDKKWWGVRALNLNNKETNSRSKHFTWCFIKLSSICIHSCLLRWLLAASDNVICKYSKKAICEINIGKFWVQWETWVRNGARDVRRKNRT